MNAADKEGAWFLRFPTNIVKSLYIMDNASAADWRVLLAICQHQGWKKGARYRKTFPLAIDQTAEEARCDRRTVFRSVNWWCKMDALRKTKDRRHNVYEIMMSCAATPVEGDNPRHNTARRQKRDDQGHFMPSDVTPKVTPHGTSEVTAYGTPNQRSLSEVFNNTAPSPPRGNSRASETSARETPKHIPSPEAIKELEKIMGRPALEAYMIAHHYPLAPIPKELAEGKETNAASSEAQAQKPQAAPDLGGKA